MKTPALVLSVVTPRLVATGLLVLVAGARAQSPGTGAIEGRVFDPGRGEYLEKARLTIEGAVEETFTDSSGQYRFTEVPAGTVKISVFFTGRASRTEVVTVLAGQSTVHDITLTATTAPPGAVDEPVRLAEFVVGASREMDAAAIAINEQRFARNIVNVVAADEFGLVVDGTPAEVLKFLPGITVEYGSGKALSISMNGVPEAYVPITIGGFDLSSTASNTTDRNTNLDQVAVNNLARIEVLHSPTPESSGSALAGSVNMVPRSAFERSRPAYSISTFISMKDGEKSFHKTPGPFFQPTRKVTPGCNFSAVVPVNRRFGFSLAGSALEQYRIQNVATNTWRGGGAATSAPAASGAPGAFPDTTPDKPYLTDFALRDHTRGQRLYSTGLTADYKFAPNDTLAFSFHYFFNGMLVNNRTLSFFVNRVAPGDWGPTFTRGAAGAGEVRVQTQAQDWLTSTDTTSLVWRHNGPTWRAEVGAGYSGTNLHLRSIDKGWFRATQARRTGVTVSFADIFYLRPNTITVTDAAGTPVDPYNLNNYALVSADKNPTDTYDRKRSAFANLRRDFLIRDVPVSLKGGLEMKCAERDMRAATTSYNYWGADRQTSTTPLGSDDAAGLVLDEVFSQRFGPYGFPQIQWIDNVKYYQLFQTHPEYFQPINENSVYRSQVTNSKYAREIISSAYLRGDVAFFNRRLRLIGGVRAEQTNVKAQGPLTDPTRNYQRDASGNVVDGNPNQAGVQPMLIVPTSNALGVSQLTFLDRGQQTQKEYLRLFPNLNASFNFRDNLTARAAYYHSVGRPNFNQYAGGLTLPNTEDPPSSSNVIRVNNAGIKVWSAKTVKVRLEYYFERVGQVSIGAFRRDFENFFGSTTFNATPEFLGLYNLDVATYDAFDVVTDHNLTDPVRMTGLEFDYRQALTFLPAWARGVQVFVNATALRATGAAADNFAGFTPRSGNWGMSLTRQRYNLKLNWHYRGARRQNPVASGRSIDPGTYTWDSRRLYIDVSGEYYFYKRYALFANLRNINNDPDDLKIFGPNTPTWARFRQRSDYGASWIFGIKGAW